jgi:CDP-diacylglycerol--glycerol-3-phosphate 3-phosphatidyltransferase
LRYIFRGAVHRVARPFVARGIRPDTVTYLSSMFAFLAMLVLTLFKSQTVYAMLVFLVGFFDGVDGAVARESGMASSGGAFTDSLVDKVSEAIVILAIPFAFPAVLFIGISVETWSFVCVSGWLLTSYARSRAESLGVKDLDVGLGARSERLFLLFLLSLCGLVFVALAVVSIVGIGTAAYRFVFYRNQLRSERENDDTPV